MKLSARLNDFNAYLVEFDVSGLAPPLLVSSLTGLVELTDFWCFSCVPIEHTRLYLSHLAVVNSLQIPNHEIMKIS